MNKPTIASVVQVIKSMSIDKKGKSNESLHYHGKMFILESLLSVFIHKPIRIACSQLDLHRLCLNMFSPRKSFTLPLTPIPNSVEESLYH